MKSGIVRYGKRAAESGGHSLQNEILNQTLSQRVSDNRLTGAHVLEFTCGEGAAGVILSQLGCKYPGTDIAPTAIRCASEHLREFPDAHVMQSDMINDPVAGRYDAAPDCMCLPMLVTDRDGSELAMSVVLHHIRPQTLILPPPNILRTVEISKIC